MNLQTHLQTTLLRRLESYETPWPTMQHTVQHQQPQPVI